MRHQFPTQQVMVAEQGLKEGQQQQNPRADLVVLRIFPSHTEQERLKQGKTNLGGRAKTGDSFLLLTLHPATPSTQTPPKPAPGHLCSRLLSEFQLSLSETNWEQMDFGYS